MTYRVSGVEFELEPVAQLIANKGKPLAVVVERSHPGKVSSSNLLWFTSSMINLLFILFSIIMGTPGD